jgi:transcription elongation factor GreA
MLEMRISKLKDVIATSKIIDGSQLDLQSIYSYNCKIENNVTKGAKIHFGS